jgi:hypothetical protein
MQTRTANPANDQDVADFGGGYYSPRLGRTGLRTPVATAELHLTTKLSGPAADCKR